MYCPACKKKTLKPSKLAYGLPSFSCNFCGGSLIEVLSYRMWTEGIQRNRKTKQLHIKDVPQDSKHALVCPKCSKLMTKFLISGEAKNKVDLCGNCGRFWLDGGEWGLLEHLNIENEITHIFNEPWQKSIRQSRTSKMIEDKIMNVIGESEYEKLQVIREWISAHENKQAIVDYINAIDENRK